MFFLFNWKTRSTPENAQKNNLVQYPDLLHYLRPIQHNDPTWDLVILGGNVYFLVY